MFYANLILSLTKASPSEPFKLQAKFLDEVDVATFYLPDGKIWLPDMSHNKKDLAKVDAHFYELLQHILTGIEDYPYTWPLEGKKLNDYGYDLYLDNTILRLSPTALFHAQTVLQYQPDKTLEKAYSRPVFVTAPHLTKLSLTLAKASALSELAFQFHSVQPVRLASLVYESDLSGFNHPIEVDVDSLQISQSNENISLLFGKPILARRLTFVLAQDNLLSTQGLGNIQIENFNEPLTDGDAERVAKWVEQASQKGVS